MAQSPRGEFASGLPNFRRGSKNRRNRIRSPTTSLRRPVQRFPWSKTGCIDFDQYRDKPKRAQASRTFAINVSLKNGFSAISNNQTGRFALVWLSG
jgi:hypothetical protein